MPARYRSVFLSISLILILTLSASSACAEPRTGIMEVRGTIGYSNFLDEGPLHHLVTGGVGAILHYEPDRDRARVSLHVSLAAGY